MKKKIIIAVICAIGAALIIASAFIIKSLRDKKAPNDIPPVSQGGELNDPDSLPWQSN